jgi:endonuclease III-like uncharacterized protein
MVKLSVEEIKEIIRPCGLSPMKSKGIYGLSQILIADYNGQVPCSFEALEALPAVGHKTASVVMSQAFGIPAFPVDTHIHRLMYRWNLSSGKNVIQTEKDAKSILKSEFGLFKNDTTVKEYKPQDIPKEELKIHFGPSTKEEFNEVKKEKKDSKLKKTLKNWKEQQSQEGEEGFKVGKGGG